jgi:amino acid permease
MFSILNEIADNSHFRTTSVIFASIGGACALYILTGITGYLSYGDNIKGNIVSMYPTAAASTIGRLAIVILVMFSYPLQIHPCRASIDACLKWRPKRRSQTEASPTRNTLLNPPPGQINQARNTEMSDMRFAVISTVLIVLSFITAMTVSSLEKVLAYVGSTGSTTISFILPGLFYYKISDPDSTHHQRLIKDEDDEDEDEGGTEGYDMSDAYKSRTWRRGLLRNLALALAIYGACVMITCLITNIFLVAGGH